MLRAASLRVFVGIFLFLASSAALAQDVAPHRSFSRLVTSNGWIVASYDVAARRLDTFLEHPYRFAAPREDALDLCFEADETRDLAYDAYFGIRSSAGGEWLAEVALDSAAYVTGTNILRTEQHAGPSRALKIVTHYFAPPDHDAPALIMTVDVANVSDESQAASIYALMNFHLGGASGGRDPNADLEEVSYDEARRTLYEYSAASVGTIAYVALEDHAHRSTSTGDNSAYARLLAGLDLDDASSTGAPTSDVAPGFQAPAANLAPGQSTSFAIAVLFAPDEDAGPDVDALLTWHADRSPGELVEAAEAWWTDWHTEPPESLSASQQDLWRHSNAILRMGQVRESGAPFGQVLASLPPGLGNVSSQWNIAWVRDMAYATAAFARAGHLEEAEAALRFQLQAGPGRHEAEVGMPYRLSATRYFGNGAEESDCNEHGPNIEFDGFGLFLWTLGEYARAGGDIEEFRDDWPVIRDEIADVLVSLIDDQSLIAADSSIWEVHWNGQQRRFTYSSLAAARGLCEIADAADELGESADAARYRAAGAQVRDAIAELLTDPRGTLVQSAEDLLAGHHYIDAAAIEAVNWGIVHPRSRSARATFSALREHLTVGTGLGLMRNDDGGDYDSQEWVFVDLRFASALDAAGEGDSRDAMMAWLEGQAGENDLQFSELHTADLGDYAGSIPMVGFGAGAYVLATSEVTLEAACGEYGDPEVPDPIPDAGAGTTDDAGVEPPSSGGCATAMGGSSGWPFVALLVSAWVLRRRGARLVLAAMLAACDSPQTADEDAAVPNPGLCPVELEYQANDSTPRVFVAGSFNDFAEDEDELVDDGSGRYRITLNLAPGLYPYKFVVEGDGREPWRLDPDNSYRAYDEGIENSGLRVADCFRPALTVSLLEVNADGAEIELTYSGRRAGPLTEVRAELRRGRSSQEAVATFDGDVIRLSLEDLEPGKYQVSVTAVDTGGVESEARVVPFWVEASPFSWEDALVYLVFTDRFRNGDPSSDSSPSDAAAGADFVGGDLTGVAAAIDEGYFDDLGVNTLWITPFNENPAGTYLADDEVHMVSGYHGYWPIEPLSVDARYGGDDALHELIEVAHEHGIRVLMDLVLNHVHEDHPYVDRYPEWFNSGCICSTDGCDWTVRRLDCLFRPYMPDVNWANNDASEQFITDAIEWLARFDLDGFRVDAVKHVVDGAIFNLRARVDEELGQGNAHYFMMGETAMGWDGSSGPDAGGNPENYDTISRYVGSDALDGQFDFVLYYAASTQFLGDTPGRGMAHVDYWTQQSFTHYPPGAIMTPYIGSHDSSRFLSLQSDPSRANNKWEDLPEAPTSDEPYDRMYIAFGWLLALPGAPLLYYGDEYGEFGGADPDNRHMMRFEDELSARESAQLERVRELTQARRDHAALRSRIYRTLVATDDLWVVARGEGSDLVIVMINRSASSADVVVPIPTEVAPEGSAFTDVAAVTSPTEVAVERAALTVSLPPRSVRYFALD